MRTLAEGVPSSLSRSHARAAQNAEAEKREARTSQRVSASLLGAACAATEAPASLCPARKYPAGCHKLEESVAWQVVSAKALPCQHICQYASVCREHALLLTIVASPHADTR